MNNLKITIHRYELTSLPSPRRIVGFLISHTDSDRVEYRETFVPLSACENKTENQICVLAYKQIQSQIETISKVFSSTESIIGSEFLP